MSGFEWGLIWDLIRRGIQLIASHLTEVFTFLTVLSTWLYAIHHILRSPKLKVYLKGHRELEFEKHKNGLGEYLFLKGVVEAKNFAAEDEVEIKILDDEGKPKLAKCAWKNPEIGFMGGGLPFALSYSSPKKIHRHGDFYVLVMEKRDGRVRVKTFSNPEIPLEAKKSYGCELTAISCGMEGRLKFKIDLTGWDGSFSEEALRSAIKAPKRELKWISA